MTTARFDLVSRAWISVRLKSGEVTELCLLDAFARAHDCVTLAGELATQDFAVLRLLLAVFRRSHPEVRDIESWGEVWARGAFHPEPVNSYLDRHRSRFDLVHPETPFYQVAGLSTAKGGMTELARLVADVPAGHQYFATRSGVALESMSLAEAARWIVHSQAFDPSGIKSGAVGDDRVKGGKGYPIGIAWCGWLGGIVVEGRNLFETVLLNTPLGHGPLDPAADLPAWERSPQGPSIERRPGAPYGPIDLLTWQSRRIRLDHDGSRATGVLIANGDPLHPRNLFLHEYMTTWRYSEPQTKEHGEGSPVFMPRGHQPDRTVWRGLEGLLAETAVTDSVRTSKPGRWLEWLAELRDDDSIPRNLPVRLRAVGMHYGAQSSVTEDIADDALALAVEVLGNRTLRAAAVDAVRHADTAARRLAQLASELAEAAGASGDHVDTARSRARERVYALLDAPYRRWLAALRSDGEPEDALVGWQRDVVALARRLASEMTWSAGPAAWVGRRVTRGNDRVVYLDAALAELAFRRQLRKDFPSAHDPPPEEVRA